MLHLACFGTVRATIDGAPVDLGGRRQRSVVGMLAAAGGRTVSTDRLLDEVWSGEPPPSATGALQAYVSRLRSALEPGRKPRQPAQVLVSAPPGYALTLPEGAVDTWHFAALLRRAGAVAHPDPAAALALAEEALALWRDEPFAEYADEEWAATEAARLTDLRSTAVELRAAAALRLGRAADTVADLEGHVRAHPLREEAVGLLARGLYAAGRQADALGALAALRERLADELGLDPGPGLRRLETDILQQADHLAAPPTPPPPAPEAAAPPAVVPATPPASPAADRALVGRETELAHLDAAADVVRTERRGGVVWVDGDAGFGKSTLLDAFCAGLAGRPGWAVARGRCSEMAGTPPGWAWHEVLDALGVEADSTAGSPDAFTLAATVADAIDPLAEGGRTVVAGVEDVHRADELSLQVLRHLVQSDVPVLVVATYRSHEVGRDLAATLAVTTDRTLERLSVGGLGDRDARALLAEHVEVDLPDRVWRRLVDRAAGNPLFLRQLGTLVAAEGPGAAEALPVAIRDLLRRRLLRLPEATVEVLSRAALLGRDIDLDLVVALEEDWSGLGEDEVADHLDAALVAGLVVSEEPGDLRFVHALVAETFADLLAPLRRQRLHRAAVAVLERDRPDAVEELAHHAAAALDRRTADRALPHLLAAAERAGDAAAVVHLRAALRALELSGAPRTARFAVRRDLVRALARSGDTLAARAERELALAEARAHGTPRDVALAWSWAAPVLWSRRPVDVSYEAAVVEISSLLADLGGAQDDGLRVELLCAMALECDPGGLELLVPAADEALRVAERLDDPERLCRALNAQYLSTFARDAVFLPALASRLVEVAAAAGLDGYEAAGHLMLQSAALRAGDREAARGHAREALRVSTPGQLGEMLLVDAVLGATDDLLADRLDAARATFDAVCRQITLAGDPNGPQIELWAGFTVAFAAGDASALLPAARAQVPRLPRELNDILVCTLVDAGDVDAARALWDPSDWERDATWLYRTALRSWLAVRLGRDDLLDRLHDDLAPWAGHLALTLNGALALGPVDHYLALLAAARGDDAAALRHAGAAAAMPGAGLVRRRP
ncbi:BTAD domain-containing putative transcriptional regulator [Nocardioides sp. CFH 31398]|uniref:BTAD domain-containing putative transcriptional regulator n=1 Tax=Nocardioides sp. CFH 31398 TaxID=2919579 RepID=UPI001F06805B|nr:BTAD domain-containing putative transcriptional regulator [Nocardioides sp. CFH 31398]MCH1864938.1 AAA family ATPase [Nocardioides sp. CFH 31398]